VAYKDKKQEREYHKLYYQTHKKEIIERVKQWQKDNLDKVREKDKRWREKHPDAKKQYYQKNRERCIAYSIQYNKEHPENFKKRCREYQRKHIDEIRAKARIWNKTPNGKKSNAKKYNRRHRNLGFIPLNEYFEGCEAHHIDNKHIIYMPTILHRSIRHSLKTGKNMDTINRLAFQYISLDSSKKYSFKEAISWL